MTEARYTVLIATAGMGGTTIRRFKGGHTLHFLDPDPRAAFAWEVFDPAWARVADGTSAFGPEIRDYHTGPALTAALQAIAHVPDHQHVHFVSDLEFFTDLLNQNSAVRRAREYRKSKGKGKLGDPLACHDQWRALDDLADERGLTVGGGRANTERELEAHQSLKLAASDNAWNSGNGPGEWGR